MIAYISGVLAHKGADAVVVEAGGIGYALAMSTNSLGKMPEVGQPVCVQTYLQVRDDGLSLFGFATPEERDLFEKLIGVSTVGPKMALAALSTFAPDALSHAIMASDVDAVATIPGIGKKKASRIILELQGTLKTAEEGVAGQESAVLRAAFEDLLSLGYTSAEAELALAGAPEGAAEAEALQYALKRLGQ